MHSVSLLACRRNRRGTRPDQAVIAACRQRADEVFLKQNRDLLSRQNPVDLPLSSTGYDPLQTTRLAGRYERDNMLDDCIRAEQTGTAVGSTSTGSATGSVPGLAPGVPVPATAAAPAAASGAPGAGPASGRDLTVPPPP